MTNPFRVEDNHWTMSANIITNFVNNKLILYNNYKKNYLPYQLGTSDSCFICQKIGVIARQSLRIKCLPCVYDIFVTILTWSSRSMLFFCENFYQFAQPCRIENLFGAVFRSYKRQSLMWMICWILLATQNWVVCSTRWNKTIMKLSSHKITLSKPI